MECFQKQVNSGLIGSSKGWVYMLTKPGFIYSWYAESATQSHKMANEKSKGRVLIWAPSPFSS